MNTYSPLADHMAFLSRKYFRSDWHDGLEYWLWHCLKNGSEIERVDLVELERLHNRTLTWVAREGDKFYEMDVMDWLELYQAEMGNE